jgi:hypothetical protein
MNFIAVFLELLTNDQTRSTTENPILGKGTRTHSKSVAVGPRIVVLAENLIERTLDDIQVHHITHVDIPYRHCLLGVCHVCSLAFLEYCYSLNLDMRQALIGEFLRVVGGVAESNQVVKKRVGIASVRVLLAVIQA